MKTHGKVELLEEAVLKDWLRKGVSDIGYITEGLKYAQGDLDTVPDGEVAQDPELPFLGAFKEALKSRNSSAKSGGLAAIKELESLGHDFKSKKTYLLTLRLAFSFLQSGEIGKLAKTEVDKKKKSLATRDLKKEVMQAMIENIYKKNPHRPKTLGEVWRKFDRGNEAVINRKANKVYIAKTGNDAEGNNIVIVTGDLPKPFKYAKRSLQRFIDELKTTHK